MPFESAPTGYCPSTRRYKMNTRNLIALATFGGLMVAAGCTKNDNNAVDTAGTAAMADTGMGTSTGTMGTTGTTGTMTDTTGATTGTMADTTASNSGDTIKR